MLLWDSSPHRRLLFRICVAPFLSVISWLVTRLLFRICVQNLCSSFSVSYQLISDKWTHKWNSFLWAIQLLPLWQKVCRKAHCKSIIMSEKRTRISLAQKLDIIEASKKSGFSIEDVMKKYGLKKSTVYRLLAEKEKYTQQEVNTPSSNRVKPVHCTVPLQCIHQKLHLLPTLKWRNGSWIG